MCAALAMTVVALSGQGIAGEIDGPKALRFLYGSDDAAAAASVGVYRVQSAVVNGEHRWFLYTVASQENNNCHACTVALGAAMFVKRGEQWIKKYHDPEVGRIGSYGMPPEAKPIQWGRQAFGLLVDGGWTGQGLTTSSQALFGFEDGKCRLIFGVLLSSDDGASLSPDRERSFEATLSFVSPAATGIFDPAAIFDLVIKVTNRGKRAEGVPAAGVYRYDGKVYRHIKTHAELGKE